MSESLETIKLDTSQLRAIEEVGAKALQIVNRQYGSGFPHFSAGQHKTLPFHGGYHTEAVPRDAVKIGQHLGFSKSELMAAFAGGRAHDVVQCKARGVMERESAEWFETEMRRKGLPEGIVRAGSLAILGTEPLLKGNKVVGQMVDRLEYPSKSAERVARSVACGDFGDLYRPKGPLLAYKFCQELYPATKDGDFPLAKVVAFARDQVSLVQSHKYALKEGERILATHKSEVIAYSEQVLRQLENGDITSWEQLEAQDIAFMRRPR